MSGNYQAGINPEFAARLARVQSGGLGTSRTIFVGIDEAFYVPKNRSFSAAVPNAGSGLKISPLAVALSLALGFFAFCAGQYLRFRFLSEFEIDAELEMIANLGIGVMVGYLLTQTLQLSGKLHQTAQIIGVFAGLCSFHNLVHWYPQLSKTVFSPEWVAAVINTTEPNSIVFRGVTYVLGS